MIPLTRVRLAAVITLLALSPCQVAAFMGFGSDPVYREFTSNPTGASVFFSTKEDEPGALIGKTPLKEEIKDPKGKWPAGYYRAEMDGYKPSVKLVTAPAKPSETGIKLQFDLQPVTTIRLSITSKPPEATILFGTDQNNISKQLGTAPYRESKTDAVSDKKPVWEKGFYKALLKGYRPKIIAVEETAENRELSFELEPLPQPPEPPKVEYPDIKSIAYKPLTLDVYKNPDMELSGGIPIAIMNLKENTGMAIGQLATDSLILKLQRKGFVILEREVVEKGIADMKTSAPGEQKSLVDIEVLKQLGELLKTRYFMIGTINEYASGNETIAVIPTIPDKEKERYLKEYEAYTGYFKSEDIPMPQQPKSIQEWELDYNSNGRSATMNVAKVSLTAKILDVKSGKAVWTGIASVSDTGLQKGLNKIIGAVVDSIAEKGDDGGAAGDESGKAKKR